MSDTYKRAFHKGVKLVFERITSNFKALEKALDASWLRNEAISQNIANADTPNYKRKTVEFEEQLNQALGESRLQGRRTHERHIPIGKRSIDNVVPKVTEDHKALSMRLDGNNVDIDNEMASMAKNSIKYNVLVQGLNSGLSRIKYVIGEGRR